MTMLDGQMQHGGEPAARPCQPVITRLSEHTAGRFLLQITLQTSPGRMLMGATDSGVDAQIPHDRTFRVGLGLEPGQGRCQVPSRCHRRNRS